MIDFKYAIVATPSQSEYSRLESFVCSVLHTDKMMRNDIWKYHQEETCIRITRLHDDRFGFAYCPREYYEVGAGVKYTELAPEILQICSVDTFIDYMSGYLQCPQIANDTLASLL